MFATNTSLPAGDIQIIGFAAPELAGEWPERAVLNGPPILLVLRQTHKICYAPNEHQWCSARSHITSLLLGCKHQQFDGTFGRATIFHEPALIAAGFHSMMLSNSNLIQFSDGDPETLTGEKANLRGFSVNATHWFIKMVNGGDSDLPPCGPVNPDDPNSIIRCEIVRDEH